MLLAVTIRTSKLTSNAHIIWERAHAALYALLAGYRVNCTNPLDKDSIDI